MPQSQESLTSEKCQDLLKEAEAILHYLVETDLESCQNASVIVTVLSAAALDRVRHSIEEPC